MHGEQTELRAGGYQGTASVHTAGLRALAANLNRRDGGPSIALSLQEDVTRSGATARSLLDGVAAASYDIAYMASSYLAAQVPELAVLDLPFSVSDRNAALSALDGDAGRRLSSAVAHRTNLEVLAYWDNGFRHLSNSLRSLRHPRDCSGLVVRTLDNEVYRETMAAIGMVPLVTDVRDLVRAVAEGQVDAQENPLTNLVGLGVYRYHPHLSMTGHFFGVALLVANAERLASLPAGMQELLRDAADAATAEQRKLAAAEDITALRRLRAEGVAVLEPEDIDLSAFRSAAEPVSARVQAGLDPDLVASYCGSVR